MADKLLLKILYNEELQFYNSEQNQSFTIGSAEVQDDIYFRSPILSSKHLLFKRKGKNWFVTNKSSLPNVYYRRRRLKPNATRKVRMERPIEIYERNMNESVVLSAIRNIRTPKNLQFKQKTAGKANASLLLGDKNEYLIGRSKDCDIVVDNPQIDPYNTKIIFDGFNFYIEDLKSSNGTAVNNMLIKRQKLNNYDMIAIPTAVYMFLRNQLIYSSSTSGIDIDVVHISKVVQDMYTKKPLKLIDDVNMSIKAGEYVAVVGGSGAGKSTILDCMNGRRPATHGNIYYDLNDYYENMLSYQSVLGYVPQKDIMHENLTVQKALYYYAAIRMRNNLTKREIYALCDKAMNDVSLLEKKHVKISSLSGGQKKRVSIAMELLADPKVIFLDEPTSGLSPDLDYELMTLLQDLSKNQGRTIVVITHAMENVDKCDKIAFLGKGGRLCYFGAPANIFKFFGLNKYSLIFSLLSGEEKSIEYQQRFRATPEYAKTLQYFDDLYGEEAGGNEK